MIAPVEAEVRGLLGTRFSPPTTKPWSVVTGKLLRDKNQTVAVCEDMTCGHLAERLQTADPEHFGAGFICNGEVRCARC